MDKFIRGCQILSSLGCEDICAEHDIILFGPTTNEPSSEQKKVLDECGFFESSEYGGWAKFP